jgi:5-methyltetrahydrofolate--homocysteine methyltransferase
VENKIVTGESFVFFDGAMGTMLQRAGLKPGELPERWNIERPDDVAAIHRKYIEAGADFITTNTFGANAYKLAGTGLTVAEIVAAAVKVARSTATGKRVALDIGPIGQLLEPAGKLTFDDAYAMFAEQVKAGASAGADAVIIETFSDLLEAKAAILAVKENSNLPVICTLTFQQDGRTLMGADPVAAVIALQGLGLDAIGANCSLGPKEMLPVAEKMLAYAKIPVIFQPNAGLPKISGNESVYTLTPAAFAKSIAKMARMGARIFGGCCGTDPSFIAAAKAALANLKPKKTKPRIVTAVAGATHAVIFDEGVKVIGERINPTGKKLLKEALLKKDFDYVASEAVSQKDAGADILDVNVGVPGIDETEAMRSAVRRVQEVSNLPLQIDSNDPRALEAGVRAAAGKPLINSVNGKKSALDSVLPIAKKYGACVLGLTLDDSGIPPKAKERFAIAERIVAAAEAAGIPREDVLIDCLVLTASAQQAEVLETVKTMQMVREKLKVRTVLGVSNVSFGLPRRDILNRTFLAMALGRGLDAAIMNPLASDMMDTVRAFRVLANADKQATEFIAKYADTKPPELPATSDVGADCRGGSKTRPSSESARPDSGERDLKSAILSALKSEAVAKVKNLLSENVPPMEIVEKHLIPALDEVGKKYEKCEIFLPQLIQSAETVKAAFEEIRKRIPAGDAAVSRGKIVLATVRGDIHDIGKNIVKVLLENYGYVVIDLGKDVAPEKIVEAAKNEGAPLVGLSALMTTTVRGMEDTIKAIRAAGLKCFIAVGGAVVTEDYAKSIGADFYAKDAGEGVKIARKVFGN